MKYHLMAFISGFLLDLILGDPYFFPHPVRAIGALVDRLERKWNSEDKETALKNGRYFGYYSPFFNRFSVSRDFGSRVYR